MILYRLLYGFFITGYKMLIHFASFWNPKAKLWVNGRKNIFIKLGQDFEKDSPDIIWMHCASVGEFEQGRPLLENIKILYPGYKILLTFFSPSGYVALKGSTLPDYIYYLPFGNSLVAQRFINLVKPALVLWIKYDYWYYYLQELKKKNIPVLLISANFSKDQLFFKWYGKLYQEMLHFFSHLFVQTEQSKHLLHTIGFSKNITIAGDTRFDRVIEIANGFTAIDTIDQFCGHEKVIVAGSTWREDEEGLDHFANTHPEIKFIIAPHEIDEPHLKNIEKLFKSSVRYSVFQKQLTTDQGPARKNSGEGKEAPANVLIIDNIGMLSRLYKYATVAYVGGGFGEDGVHNILEAAVYGKPVIFGPVFNKYIEAIELLEEKAAFTVDNALELEKVLVNLFSDTVIYREMCEAAKKYVTSKKGATETILRYIQEKRLLTS